MMMEVILMLLLLMIFVGVGIAYVRYKTAIKEFWPHAIGGMSPLGKSQPPTFLQWLKFEIAARLKASVQ
jgi:hypothetical protein